MAQKTRIKLVITFVFLAVLLGVFLEANAQVNALEEGVCYFNKKNLSIFKVDEVILKSEYLVSFYTHKGFNYGYGQISNDLIRSSIKDYAILDCRIIGAAK